MNLRVTWILVLFCTTTFADPTPFQNYCVDKGIKAEAIVTLKALLKRLGEDTTKELSQASCEKLESEILKTKTLSFGGDQFVRSPRGKHALPWSDNVTDISLIRFFPHLTRLELNRNEGIDLTPLSELPELQTLSLRNLSRVDLNLLAGLKKLTQLDLRFSGVEDLTPLSQSPALSRLAISDTAVKALTVLGAPVIARLTLLLADRTQIADWNALVFEKLETLSAQESTWTDLAPLSKATRLRILNLQKNAVKDLSALKPLVDLTELNIVGTQTEDKDIEVLAELVREHTNSEGKSISLKVVSGPERLIPPGLE